MVVIAESFSSEGADYAGSVAFVESEHSSLSHVARLKWHLLTKSDQL